MKDKNICLIANDGGDLRDLFTRYERNARSFI